MSDGFIPVFEITRGNIVEIIHYGAAAIVDSSGKLLFWLGDPQRNAFLRSSAKPLQAIPLIESAGDQAYDLTSAEIAIMCASHDGTEEHVAVVRSLQSKIDVSEENLLCGIHEPLHKATAEDMKRRGESPTPNRHNCSGKHTGMLALGRLKGFSLQNYIDPKHPIQQTILQAFAEICSIPVEQVELGVDGCSAPVFAVPLYNAALGYARLCDPNGLSAERAAACKRITGAMVSNPFLVGGAERFDSCLMNAGVGRILAKGGAQGYLALGIMAGALGEGSPGIGITIKISDGDPEGKARPAVALEILHQLDFIHDKEMNSLLQFGPVKPVYNWRQIVVGESHPVLKLKKTTAGA